MIMRQRMMGIVVLRTAIPQGVLTPWVAAQAQRSPEVLTRYRLYLLHYFRQHFMLAHDDHVYMIPANIVRNTFEATFIDDISNALCQEYFMIQFQQQCGAGSDAIVPHSLRGATVVGGEDYMESFGCVFIHFGII